MSGKYPERIDISDIEIEKLLIIYKQNENSLQSLFDDKIYNLKRSWVDSFARNGISKLSRNKLLFKIHILENGVTKCCYCEEPFTIIDFNYPNIKRFCKKCSDNQEFRRSANLDRNKLKIRSERISLALNKFHNTDIGKLNAKRIGQINKEHLTGRTLTEERKKAQSITMLKMIADGDFSPGINNNFTHWKSTYIDINNSLKKFRSSWELCFYFCNDHLIYEKMRIPYINADKETKTYIADFYDKEENIIFELKPSIFWVKQSQKMNAIIEYCLSNNITFIWINEHNIMSFLNSEKILNSQNTDIIANYNKMLKGIELKDEIRKN